MCRGKPLQDSYLQKLVLCMEQLFFSLYSVTPSLVADFNQHVYRSAGYVGMSLEMVTMETKAAVADKRLFRCLVCTGISCIPEVQIHVLYNVMYSLIQVNSLSFYCVINNVLSVNIEKISI